MRCCPGLDVGAGLWSGHAFACDQPYDQTYLLLLPSGLLGEMLSGAFNVIGFSWIGSPAATELETVGCAWQFLL